MAANYAGFTVWYEDRYGVRVNVGTGVSVVLYNRTQDAVPAESPLTTDSNGAIAAGSLTAGAAGDLVSFRVDNYLTDGLSASATQLLT